MSEIRHRRAWILIAAIAIAAAVVLLLIPHVHAGDGGSWLAILPILFVGLISPLSLLSPLADVYESRTPDAPVLPAQLQRPPPFTVA